MRNVLEIGMLIVTFGIGVIYPNHFLLSLITILAVGLNMYFFFKDKRELKMANYYARLDKNPGVSQIIVTIVLVVAGCFGLYSLFLIIPKEIWEKGMTIYIPIIVFSTFFANYYQHFTSSIRSFDFGIVIPKPKEKKTDWASIKSITINGSQMTIEIKNEEKITYEIDKRDLKEALKIKNQFEEKCL